MVKPALVRKTTTHFVVEPKMGICNDTSTSNGGPKKELRSLIPIFWQVKYKKNHYSSLVFCSLLINTIGFYFNQVLYLKVPLEIQLIGYSVEPTQCLVM